MSIRDEFEAWVVANWPNQSLDRFNPLHGVTEGEYTFFTVQQCWQAWQASRAALVIELPLFAGYQDHIVRELQAAFTASVEAADLKVTL